MKIIQEGRGARVPVLLGTNLDEIRYWSTIEELPLESKPPALLEKQVAAIVGDRASALVDTYQRADSEYGEAVIHLETDLLFRMTSIRMAEAIADLQPTYMYLFTYRSTSPWARYESAHSMEVPFVFGLIDELDSIDFIGRGPSRALLMEQMQQAWIQFARTGDPNHPGLPHWPRYERTRRATMRKRPSTTRPDITRKQHTMLIRREATSFTLEDMPKRQQRRTPKSTARNKLEPQLSIEASTSLLP